MSEWISITFLAQEKILEWLEDLLIKFAESLFGFARKIMDKMNTIEGYDWDGFIDYVMGEHWHDDVIIGVKVTLDISGSQWNQWNTQIYPG